MSSKQVHLVCYDIADPKRWKRVFDICKSYGQHSQYSVFVMTLTETQRVTVQAALAEVMHTKDDRILMVRIGPAGQRTNRRFTSLGYQREPEAIGAIVV